MRCVASPICHCNSPNATLALARVTVSRDANTGGGGNGGAGGKYCVSFICCTLAMRARNSTVRDFGLNSRPVLPCGDCGRPRLDVAIDSLECRTSLGACDPLAMVSATCTPLITFLAEANPVSLGFRVAAVLGPVISRKCSLDRETVRVRPSEDTSVFRPTLPMTYTLLEAVSSISQSFR